MNRVPDLELIEMDQSRKNSLCCGGGGGRIWMDTPKEERFSDLRLKDAKRIKVMGIVSPHAGYVYSGKVAGETFSRVVLPDKYIILAPNHTGIGPHISLYSSGTWETPLGSIEVDSELAQKIRDKLENIKEDVSAHMMEHSLEVQLPFLQYFKKDFKIIPFSLGRLTVKECSSLGRAIAEAIRESDEDILIVASSDMTHYESAKQAEKKDKLAISNIEKLDPEGLFETVRSNGISMCGVIPTTVMLFAAKELGAKKGTLVKYSNSGETSGDYDEVVGYAGLYVS